MKAIIYSHLLLAVILLVGIAQSAGALEVEFVTGPGAELLDGGFVSVTAEDTLTSEKFSNQYFMMDGSLSLNLKQSDWELEFFVDTDRDGMNDYASSLVTNDVDGSYSLIVREIGVLTGIVYDNFENRISGCALKLECIDMDYMHEFSTDNFGRFIVSDAPAANCLVSAIADGKVGETMQTIEKGKLNEITISLDENLLPTEEKSLWGHYISIIFGVALLGLLSVVLFIRFRKKSTHQKDSQDEVSKQARDIISTLSKKEQKIIWTLINSEGNSISQSKIFYQTLIPKTSLSRVIDNLASKNILAYEKIGKMKKVFLTTWFKDIMKSC